MTVCSEEQDGILGLLCLLHCTSRKAGAHSCSSVSTENTSRIRGRKLKWQGLWTDVAKCRLTHSRKSGKSFERFLFPLFSPPPFFFFFPKCANFKATTCGICNSYQTVPAEASGTQSAVIECKSCNYLSLQPWFLKQHMVCSKEARIF